MLEYDNTAFYYFLLSVLTFYLVPSYVAILRSVAGCLGGKAENVGRTEKEKLKARKVRRDGRLYRERKRTGTEREIEKNTRTHGIRLALGEQRKVFPFPCQGPVPMGSVFCIHPLTPPFPFTPPFLFLFLCL